MAEQGIQDLSEVTAVVEGDRLNIQRRDGSWKNYGVRIQDLVGKMYYVKEQTINITSLYANNEVEVLPDISGDGNMYCPLEMTVKYTPDSAEAGTCTIYLKYDPLYTQFAVAKISCDSSEKATSFGFTNDTYYTSITGMENVSVYISEDLSSGNGTLTVRIKYMILPYGTP